MIPEDMQFDLRDVVFTPELLACIPAKLAQQYRVLPIFCSATHIQLAVTDPSDFEGIEAVQAAVRREVELCLVEASQLEEFVTRLYGTEGKREG